MMRSILYVLLTLSALGVADATVSAAELTGSTEAQTSDAKMPAGAEFSNGPAGGGAKLIGTDHIPTGAEFSNGPSGGATVDPTPRGRVQQRAGRHQPGIAGPQHQAAARPPGRAVAFVDTLPAPA